MALQNSQIDAILSISSTASLISGAAIITDTSNFTSIGVGGSDVVSILLWIQDPTTATVYKNAGYDSADYSSPDLLPLSTPKTYSFTLPVVTSGAYMQGSYTVNYKVQVVSGGGTNETYKALYMSVAGCCNGIEADVRGDVSYQTAIVSVTDYTNYKTWTALSNTIYLYPPTNTGAAQHQTFNGSPATLTYVPASGFPYTGMWQWTLSSNITYVDPITTTSTTCQLTSQGSFEVVQSQLCKVRCLLDKYRTEFYAKISVKSDPLFERNWNLAADDYMMAFMSERCGMPQTTIDKYIQNIYKITGIDPNCDCGCDDGVSQPLSPTSSINGTNGTNGADGATGATGATGQSGINILENQYPDLATLTTSYESLLEGRTPYILAANTLNVDKDELYIRAEFTCSAATPNIQRARITFNGVALNTTTVVYFAGEIKKMVQEARFSRISNSAAKYDLKNTRYVTGYDYLGTAPLLQATVSLTGLDFTSTAYSIDAQGDSTVIGDVTCTAFEVIVFKCGINGSTPLPILSSEFLLTSATSYIFNGTITAYNPTGITLIGKSLVEFFMDGLLKTTIASDYVFSSATGTITIPSTVAGVAAKIIYQ